MKLKKPISAVHRKKKSRKKHIEIQQQKYWTNIASKSPVVGG
jgi:hypothetical protein